MERRLFTSESVTEGHPDKVCDLIADSILDEIFAQDSEARCAIEVCCTTNYVFIFGEVSTTAKCDYEKVARDIIKNIGYDIEGIGFDYKTCKIKVAIDEQSGDISNGVNNASDALHQDEDEQLGAGDQGLMFGFACKETDSLMPLPITLAHDLTKRLTYVRKQGIIPYLRPDGKAQVTVEYDDGKPVRVDTIIVSTQHAPIDLETLRADIEKYVIKEAIPSNLLDDKTEIHINPAGNFIIGGPAGDSGLTGRKIIVDTYGGYCPHGGGAFSGKDPTKVDRSACYMARYVCKNLVAAGAASKVQLQLSYAIGMSHPISVLVDSFGTGIVSDEKLNEIVRAVFDLRPRAIIKSLGLNRPVYKQTSNYGHFGKDTLPWEKTDKVEQIKALLANY